MTLHIAEFKNLANAHNGSGPVPAATGLVASQELAVSSSNAQSTSLHPSTRFVRLHASEDCLVAIGPNANAETGATIRMSAGQADYFGVYDGDLVAVVAVSE